MLALVNTPNGKAPVELRQVPEPASGLHEALVAVQAFSLNRGELRSFRNNEEGWIPGQDISGIVLRQAADGSGPPAGTRIVALMDEFGWAERAATRGQPHTAPPRSESFVALREHHPRHDPHQHDHDGRNPRDNRPSPPAFFQLAQLALQIHPPSGERVR